MFRISLVLALFTYIILDNVSIAEEKRSNKSDTWAIILDRLFDPLDGQGLIRTGDHITAFGSVSESDEKYSGVFRDVIIYKISLNGLVNSKVTININNASLVAVVERESGGYYIVSETRSVASTEEFPLKDGVQVSAIDADGIELWRKSYLHRRVRARAVAKHPDGGLVILGSGHKSWQEALGGFVSLHSEVQGGWMFRIDTTGQKVWQRDFNNYDVRELVDLAVNIESDGIVILGQNRSTRKISFEGPGGFKELARGPSNTFETIVTGVDNVDERSAHVSWIGYFNLNGAWKPHSSRTINADVLYSFPHIDEPYGFRGSIAVMKDGSIAAASTQTIAVFGPNRQKRKLVEFYKVSIKGIINDDAGGFYAFGGRSIDGGGTNHGWLSRFDKSGNLIWERIYGPQLSDGIALHRIYGVENVLLLDSGDLVAHLGGSVERGEDGTHHEVLLRLNEHGEGPSEISFIQKACAGMPITNEFEKHSIVASISARNMSVGKLCE